MSTPTQFKIMVVEDEEVLLNAITSKLSNKNYEVISCQGGKQAIEKLTSEAQVPDLIWLDYYLKDMNGIEFMHQLKQNPAWAHIPVVVVSNSAGQNNVLNMMSLGASQYIVKADYRLEQIIEMMQEVINESKSKDTT